MARQLSRKGSRHEEETVDEYRGKYREQLLPNLHPSWVVYSSAAWASDSSSDESPSEDEEEEWRYSLRAPKNQPTYVEPHYFQKMDPCENYHVHNFGRSPVLYSGEDSYGEAEGPYTGSQPTSSGESIPVYESLQDQERRYSFEEFRARYECPSISKTSSPVNSLKSATLEAEPTASHGCIDQIALASIKAKCQKIVHLLDLKQSQRKRRCTTLGDKGKRGYVSGEGDGAPNAKGVIEKETKDLHVQDKEGGANGLPEQDDHHSKINEAWSVEEGMNAQSLFKGRERSAIPVDTPADGVTEVRWDMDGESIQECGKEENSIDAHCVTSEEDRGDGGFSLNHLNGNNECGIMYGWITEENCWSAETDEWSGQNQHLEPMRFPEEDLSDDGMNKSMSQEFWWDDEEMEEEIAVSMTEGYHSSHRTNQEALMEEWYEIEKIVGIEEDQTMVANEGMAHEERETLLAEWTMIEEAIAADNLFKQTRETLNPCIHGNQEQVIQDIISQAQRDIHGVVAKALEDIRAVEEICGLQNYSVAVHEVVSEMPLHQDSKLEITEFWSDDSPSGSDDLLSEDYRLSPRHADSEGEDNDVPLEGLEVDDPYCSQGCGQDSNLRYSWNVEPAAGNFVMRDAAQR